MSALVASAPQRREVAVEGVPMSVLISTVPRPRAVLLCLGGGAASTAYWDCPGHPHLSLLRTGAALGFTVVALDRPGYGSSAPFAAQIEAAERRTALTFAVVDAVNATGAPVLAVAHSLGCELGLRLAAAPRGRDFLGLALAGTGLRYHPRAQERMAELVQARSEGQARPAGMRDMVWGRVELYPPGVTSCEALSLPSPRYEGRLVATWASGDFAGLAGRVRVPVHLALGEHESVWTPGWAALCECAALFTAASRVVTHIQPGGGHNLSVGLAAAAYHLHLLAFAEECLAARAAAGGSEGSEDR